MTNNKRRTVITFIAIILGFFMALLDTTIVNISLPKMAAYFNSNVTNISWVANSYNIAFVALMLTAARLADQFGRKKLFLIGLMMFTITSCIAGLSTSFEMLILSRVLQGMSAAIIVPVVVPLIIDIVPSEKLGMVIGIWGAVGGLAAACGPGLGGVLTHWFNWQSVFFVNIPLGIIAIILCTILLKESFDTTASKYIDFPGIITISVAILSITLGVMQAPDKGWNSGYTITLLITGIVSLIAFIAIELKSKDPMLPMGLLKIRSFSAASVTIVFITCAMMAGSYLASFYLIRVMGMSQVTAGTTIMAMPIAMMVFSMIAGPVSQKIDCRILAVLGLGLSAAGIFLFNSIGIESSRLEIALRFAILGAGVGMALSPLMGTAINIAPSEKVGIASGITNLARTVGMLLGVAILTTILSYNTNIEMKKNKAEILTAFNSNAILSSEIKESLSAKIMDEKANQISEAIEVSKINDLISQTENEILKETTEDRKDSVIKKYDEMKKEVQKISEKSQIEIKNSQINSFQNSFKNFSIIILLGIVFAVFSDKRKGNKEECKIS